MTADMRILATCIGLIVAAICALLVERRSE
jgi:uncharacterized membrane protein YgaE (UPF0421/DUF939 family)